MGSVGYGSLGQDVARIADAFYMRVLYKNPRVKRSHFGNQRSMETRIRESDAVNPPLPPYADNWQLINRSVLAKIKRSAFLINTARGALINEPDLAEALNEGLLADAAFGCRKPNRHPTHNVR